MLPQKAEKELALPALSLEELRAVIEGRSLALRVPFYSTPAVSQKLAKRLLQDPRFGFYRNVGNGRIGRVGEAFFESNNNPDSRERYFENSAWANRALRSIFAPELPSPIDRLRLELDEVWPSGAHLEQLDDRKMFVGLSRVLNGGGILPHQDVLRRDAPNAKRAHQLVTQLAANIYLRLPREGGLLELWSKRPSDEEFEALKDPGSYGINRDKLPKPDMVIAPQVGELVIFDATRLHAVSTSLGIRVTLSCFIGFRGEHLPLSFWS